jgi:ketosteroid isomerase-like protein
MAYSIFKSCFIFAFFSALGAASYNTSCTSPVNRTKYPDKCHITTLFNYLSTGNTTAFFFQVSPDVQWTLMGTHPLAGQYNNRTIFIADALQRLDQTIDPAHAATLTPTHVAGGGDEEWSVQELHGLGICKNGKILLLKHHESRKAC